MDLSFLRELGPFIKVLGVISLRAQYFKNQGDQIKTGEMYCKEIIEQKNASNEFDPYEDYDNIEILKPLEDNMAGSFLLFRGA